MKKRHKITIYRDRIYRAIEIEYFTVSPYVFIPDTVIFFDDKLEIITSNDLELAIEDAKIFAKKYFDSLKNNSKIEKRIILHQKNKPLQAFISDFSRQNKESDDFFESYVIAHTVISNIHQENSNKIYNVPETNFSESFFKGANEAIEQSNNSWKDSDYSQDTYNYSNDSDSSSSSNFDSPSFSD